MAGAPDGSYVGLFMRELPPDWWLPEGYTLSPSGVSVTLHKIQQTVAAIRVGPATEPRHETQKAALRRPY